MAAEEEEQLYSPDMLPDDEKDRVYCFIVPERACGADCMAFLNHAAKLSKGCELDDNQRHCSLLVNADRLSRHAVILTSIFATSEKKKRTAAQDATREANTPKPGPFASPAPVSPFPVEKP